MHLTLDGYGPCAPEVSRLWAFLAEAPARVQMTPIQPPVVARHPSGLAGYVLLAESHISYHGYDHDEAHIVHIDCFSCNDFDPEAFAAFASSTFGIEIVQQTLDPYRLNLKSIGVPA